MQDFESDDYFCDSDCSQCASQQSHSESKHSKSSLDISNDK